MSRKSSTGNIRESSSSSSDVEVVPRDITKEELLNPSLALFEDRHRRQRNNSATTEETFSEFERVSVYGGRHFYVSDLSQEQRKKLKKQLEDEMSDNNSEGTQSEEETTDEEPEEAEDTEQEDGPEQNSEIEEESALQDPFETKMQKSHSPAVLSIIQCQNLSIDEKLEQLESYLKMKELKQCEEYLRSKETRDLHESGSSDEGETSEDDSEEDGEKEEEEGPEEIPAEEDSDKIEEAVDQIPETEEKTRKEELMKWLEEELEETQEALEREKEACSQLREQLSATEKTITELTEKNSALEEAVIKETNRKTAREALLEEENNKKDEEIKELQKQIEANGLMTAELLENMECEEIQRDGRESLDQMQLLYTRKEEEELLQNAATPFPFMENVATSTIEIIHSAIQKYNEKNGQLDASNVDSAILLFLPQENIQLYELWKMEMAGNIPPVFLSLTLDQKLEIMRFIDQNYMPRWMENSRGLEGTRQSFGSGKMDGPVGLTETLQLAYNKLQQFLEIKKRIDVGEAENQRKSVEEPIEGEISRTSRSSTVHSTGDDHPEKADVEESTLAPRAEDQLEKVNELAIKSNDSTALGPVLDGSRTELGEEPPEEEESAQGQKEEENSQHGEFSEAGRKKIISTMPFLTHVSKEDFPAALELLKNDALTIEKKLEYLEEYLTLGAYKQCEIYLRNRERPEESSWSRRQIPEKPGFHSDNCLLLNNPSTYCFANVVVQTIYRLWKRRILNYRGDNEILLELKKIVTGRGDDDVKKLLSIVSDSSQFSFDNGAQHDAQEFWTEMLNQLPEEYQRLFKILIKKRYTCIKCGHVSTTTETENMLIIKKKLTSGKGLDEYLEYFEVEEVVQGKECPNCPMVDEKVSTHDHWCKPLLQFESTSSSQFLALRVELRQGVQFGQQHFVDRQMIADEDEYEAFDCVWSPVVMIEHIGCEFSHRGGHYVAYLKNSDGWLKIDDMAIDAMQLGSPPSMKRICFIILKRI